MKNRDCARPWPAHACPKPKNSRCLDRSDRRHFPYRNRPRKDAAKDAGDGELGRGRTRTSRNKESDQEIEDDAAFAGEKSLTGERKLAVTVTRGSFFFLFSAIFSPHCLPTHRCNEATVLARARYTRPSQDAPCCDR